MGILNLTFIDKLAEPKMHPLERICHKYGADIAAYAKGYFNYLVTVSSYNNKVQSVSLYILIPEIGTDYQVLTLRIKNINTVSVHYFTFRTQQVDNQEINITSKDFKEVEAAVVKLLESKLANQTFRFLIDQVKIKRENRDENTIQHE